MPPKKIKFRHAYDDLRMKITGNIFLPDAVLPSESELMRQYQITRYTARKVLARLEEDGLIYKRQGKGSFVKPLSFSYANKRTSKKILVIASRAEQFYFLKCINGIENALAQTGYKLTIRLSNFSAVEEAILLEEAFAEDYAGLLIFPSESAYIYTNTFWYRRIALSRTPCIFLGNTIPFVDIDSVVTDDYLGGKLAAECFLKNGHSAFVCVMNREEYSGCMRYSGFLEGLYLHGLSASSCRIQWYSHAGEAELFRGDNGEQILSLAKEASAFFCFNDAVALALCAFLAEKGLSVPDDVSLIGYDDSYICSLTPVPLTSLHQDPDQIGYTAAQNLLKKIADPGFQCSRTFLPYLVERKSVKCLTGD